MAQAELIPIDVTGFNNDIVVATGETYATGSTATQDGSTNGFAWYEVGFDVASPATGLPTGPYVSESFADTTFAFADFAGNNAAVIDVTNTSSTLTLVSPRTVSELAIFGASGGGYTDVNYTLNYADASTQNGTVRLHDWFNGTDVAVTASGRVDASGFSNVDSGNPRMYQYNLSFTDTGVALESITFDFAAGEFAGSRGSVFAVSAAVPEPGSFALLTLLAAIPFIRRRIATRVQPQEAP